MSAATYLLALRHDAVVLSGLSLGGMLFSAQGLLLGYKRYLVVSDRYLHAARASATYAVVAIGGAVTFAIAGVFSEVALVCCAAAGAVAVAFPFSQRVVRIGGLRFPNCRGAQGIGRYTTWAVITSLPAAAAVQSVYWTGAVASSIAVVGQVKLFEQLMMPVGQLLGAMSLVDQVKCSAAFAEGRIEQAVAIARRRIWQYTSIAGLYVVLVLGVVGFVGNKAHFVYGGDWVALAAYGVGIVAFAASAADSISIKMFKRPEFLAIGYAAMAVLILLSPLWFDSIGARQLSGLVACGWCLRWVILTVTVRRISHR